MSIQTPTVDRSERSGRHQAAPTPALVSWALFDWAAQPFYTLITTFLFAPYFATAVMGNGTEGQKIWGYGAAIAGIFIALGSPFLGALADGRGRRKPWIALFATIFAVAMCCLWFAVPNAAPSTVYLVLAAFIIAAISAEYCQVFTNAFLPTLVPETQLGRLSGAGWAAGYFGGLVSLIVMVGLIVAVPETGKTLLGFDPLIKLDALTRQYDRLAGPFAALWFVIFVLPFFIFVPDVPKPKSTTHPERSALAELGDTLRQLPSNPSILLFLVARMLYSDGLSAIFTFGGIYGAYIFNWGPLELGIFGIILTLTGALGALAGGFLDDTLGSKTVIIGSLVLLMVGAIGILSVDQTHILFTSDVTPKIAGSKPFSSIGEQVFLAFAVLVGSVSAPVQAASRSLLARLAPPDKITQYFGLFAFSGKATAFLAPFVVASVTAATGSQRYGMAAILLFLIVGALMMLPVKSRR
jgi:MFS transporter, UMF1 family